MLVFVAGEGPTDIGELVRDPEYRSKRPREGFIQPIVRRLRSHDDVRFDGRKIMALGKERFGDLAKGLERQAADAVAIGRAIGAAHWADYAARVVIGTPCRCLEAWALGDVESVEAVAGTGSRIQLPRLPEELWGAPNDPASWHPKRVLMRIFERDLESADYAALGDEVNPATVRRRCPESFEPFAAGVEAL